jgi:hypothetical protein
MIVKHVPVTTPKKGSFDRLVRYLTDAQGKAERVGKIGVSNCYDVDPQVAVLEVLNTQAQNTRSGADKTYHLIVSFRAGEDPDPAALQAIEQRICDGLGFAGHQRVSVAHHDTDNVHVHIAVNKIHPHRYTIHEPYLAYRTLARLCDQLENEYGLQKDNHQARKCAAENRADDMEHHAGVESLIGWIQRTCKEQLGAATSWMQLHATLAQHGLQLQARGNGLVIVAGDGTNIKASSVGREFSKPKLELRLGQYLPAAPSQGARTDDTTAKRYAKLPLRSRFDTSVLYSQYQAAQAESRSIQDREWQRARRHKQRMIESVKGRARLQRTALRLAKLPRAAKKLAYQAANHGLRREIERIHERYQSQRREIYRMHRPRQWADWLRDEAQAGSDDALAALRSRAPRGQFAGEGVSGQAVVNASSLPNCDSVTKSGTIIYRVGANAVRDDGDRLRLSCGADRGALIAALHMASVRFGERLNVTGGAGFREDVVQATVAAGLKISFVDAALERRRQQLIGAMRGLGQEVSATPYHPEQTARPTVADRYVGQRERASGVASDMSRHVPSTAVNGGEAAEYAGFHQLDGQMLAMLKRGDEVEVFAVDDATARRLNRLQLGEKVSVDPQGLVLKKGRRR